MQIMFLCLTCDWSFMSERMSLKSLYSFWCCGFHSFLNRKNICHNLCNPPQYSFSSKMTVQTGNTTHFISNRCEIKLNCHTMICTLNIHKVYTYIHVYIYIGLFIRTSNCEPCGQDWTEACTSYLSLYH